MLRPADAAFRRDLAEESRAPEKERTCPASSSTPRSQRRGRTVTKSTFGDRPRRRRNFKVEYARRVERALAKGKTLSQARGHARAGERQKSPTVSLIKPTVPEEQAIKLMTKGATLKAAASEVKVPPERLRRYLKENTSARWTGRRWEIVDSRARQMPMYSKGASVHPWLSPQEASRAGTFDHDVRRYLQTGDEAILKPYRGAGVRDVYGHLHPFETDGDVLYELDNAGELSFPEFYKIVA